MRLVMPRLKSVRIPDEARELHFLLNPIHLDRLILTRFSALL